MTYPNGQTTEYGYVGNLQDRRTSLIHHKYPGGATLLRFEYAYDLNGNITSVQQQVGAASPVVATYQYDNADQLIASRVESTNPTQVMKRFAYGYDGSGNRASTQIDDAPTSQSYDALNKLVSQASGGVQSFSGTLTEPAVVTIAGSPAAVTATNEFRGQATLAPGTTVVAVQATDGSGNTAVKHYEVDVAGGSSVLTYDANGNLIGNGTRTYEWDAENRLVAVTQGGTTVASLVYDGFGRLVQKTSGGVTRNYIHIGDHIAEERTSGGTMRSVKAPWIDQWLGRQEMDGSSVYFVADHLGSIVRHLNAAGQPVLTRSYDPWGELDSVSAAVSGLAFTGREWDADIQMYYYRARFYEPKLARFVSADPVKFLGGQGWYSYAENNPVSKIDPYGLSGWYIDWRTCVRGVSQETAANHCGNGKNSSDDPSCRVAHCVANCKITRECVGGWAQAVVTSYLKEVWDEAKQQTVDPTSEGYSQGDVEANRCGRDFGKRFPERTCETLCKDVR